MNFRCVVPSKAIGRQRKMKSKSIQKTVDLWEEYPAELIRQGVHGKYAKRMQAGSNPSGKAGEKKMDNHGIQYVLDERGRKVSVIIPISLWKELQSERETAYLLESPAMKRRLLKAKKHPKIIPAEVVLEKLGI